MLTLNVTMIVVYAANENMSISICPQCVALCDGVSAWLSDILRNIFNMMYMKNAW
jgi:hypothetical protein